MATRITKKTRKEEATPEVLEQPKPTKQAKDKPKPASLPDGFLDRAAERALDNERRLMASEVFTKAEYAVLRGSIADAYKELAKTSGPVINMTPEVLLAFLKEGAYKPFGASGKTNGTPDTEQRLDYTKRTYGYDSLEACEKYGTVPVEEVNKECPLYGIPLEKRFTSRYGTVLVELKPEVGSRSTMNVLDSGHQWGLDGQWEKNGFGWLFPVPYRTEDFDKFVGCLMSAPTPVEESDIRAGNDWGKYAAQCIRDRNYKILKVLQGMDAHDYVEAHIHGEVTPEDVAEIVFVPDCVKGFEAWKEVESVASHYSISVKPFVFIDLMQ